MERLRRRVREAARGWLVHRLLARCGAGARLVIDSMLNCHELLQFHPAAKVAQINQFAARDALIKLRDLPLWFALQEGRSAARAAPVRCSHCEPAGPLDILNISRSGSSAEGLADIFRDLPSLSDYDAMYELGGNFRWVDGALRQPGEEPERISPQEAPQMWAKMTDNTGFVLLYWARTWECQHEAALLALPAHEVRQQMLQFARVTTTGDSIIETPGPAVNVLTPRDQHGGTDRVPCLRMPIWPGKEAFLSRHRVTDFPSAAARQELCQFGVHLVPTGRDDSATFLCEWRLSFSRAEVVAIHQLNATQRAAVKAVKRIKTALKKSGAAPSLKSYYIKTAVLWLVQDQPSDRWTGPLDGVHMILDWLEHHITTGSMPCFFWPDIDLMSAVTANERNNMLKTIATMKRCAISLLMAWCEEEFYELRLVLEEDWSWRPLPMRQLRLVLVRIFICRAVMDGIEKRPSLPQWQSWAACCVPALAPSSGHQLLMWDYYQRSGMCLQQRYLLQAMLVAPADMTAWEVTSIGDASSLDVAPLMSALTDRDLRYLLGDPAAVAAWCHRELCQPPAERQSGLTAGLDTPQGRAELLLQPELLLRVLAEAVPDRRNWWKEKDKETRVAPGEPFATCQEMRDMLEEQFGFSENWHLFIVDRVPGMDKQTAGIMGRFWRRRLQHLLAGDRLRRKYWNTVRAGTDGWRLRQHVLLTDSTSCPEQSRLQEQGGDSDVEEQEFQVRMQELVELERRHLLEWNEVVRRHLEQQGEEPLDHEVQVQQAHGGEPDVQQAKDQVSEVQEPPDLDSQVQQPLDREPGVQQAKDEVAEVHEPLNFESHLQQPLDRELDVQNAYDQVSKQEQVQQSQDQEQKDQKPQNQASEVRELQDQKPEAQQAHDQEADVQQSRDQQPQDQEMQRDQSVDQEMHIEESQQEDSQVQQLQDQHQEDQLTDYEQRILSEFQHVVPRDKLIWWCRQTGLNAELKQDLLEELCVKGQLQQLLPRDELVWWLKRPRLEYDRKTKLLEALFELNRRQKQERDELEWRL